MIHMNGEEVHALEEIAKEARKRTWPEGKGRACDECNYQYGSRGERYNFSGRCKLCKALTRLDKLKEKTSS